MWKTSVRRVIAVKWMIGAVLDFAALLALVVGVGLMAKGGMENFLLGLGIAAIGMFRVIRISRSG